MFHSLFRVSDLNFPKSTSVPRAMSALPVEKAWDTLTFVCKWRTWSGSSAGRKVTALGNSANSYGGIPAAIGTNRASCFILGK